LEPGAKTEIFVNGDIIRNDCQTCFTDVPGIKGGKPGRWGFTPLGISGFSDKLAFERINIMTHLTKLSIPAIALFISLSLISCTPGERGALTGGAIGAGTGALITGNSTGALVGGAIGAIAGSEISKNRASRNRHHRHGRY